ncbi:MAG: HalD/BesD family halogenase [Myxococcota bacterium]
MSPSSPRDDRTAELVNLDTYPLLDLDSPEAGRRIERHADELRRTGAAELTGFLTDEGLARCRADARALAPRAHWSRGKSGPYLEIPDPGWPDGHPRRHLEPFSVGAVAYDLFPEDSPLRRLYEWDPMMELIGRILGRWPLYRYADPLGALNVAVMEHGDSLEWHFDQTDFVVSLALQDSDEGGDFEVAPRVRSALDERYDEVARVLAGDHERVVRLPLTPGTLLVFAGRHSIHRVSEIVGPTPRLIALLAYDEKPGTCSSELLQKVRYGRSA